MNKRYRLSFLLLAIVALGTGLVWLNSRGIVRGKSQANKAAQGLRAEPYLRIDEKALAATGTEETAIRELAKAVFNPEISELPIEFARLFEERFIRAEINYRRGDRAGIPEINVVRVIDEMAQRLDAPDYAKTSTDEIREARLGISRWMPHFIVRKSPALKSEAQDKVQTVISPTMSPLEAAYVINYLILQKKRNEWYQLTQEERAEIKRTLQQLNDDKFQLSPEQRARVGIMLTQQKAFKESSPRSLEDILKAVRNSTAPAAEGTKADEARLVSYDSPRAKEMQDVFQKAAALNSREALDLANRALNLLGLEP